MPTSPSSPLSSEEATNPRVSASNPPPMPDSNELEAARLLANLSLKDLYDSSSTSPPGSNLPVVIRCCLRLLSLLNHGNKKLADRCCSGLLDSLRAILSRDPSPSLLPAIEVFIDSLLSNEQLWSCLVITYCSALEGSAMFADGAMPYKDDHIKLELVCRHFISSLLDEKALEVFLSALSWPGRSLQRTPEISFRGALALVKRPCFFSLPAVVQAHHLLLMSRCIGDRNFYLHRVAFEYAMKLYVSYLPALRRVDGAKAPRDYLDKKISFCCINDTTKLKLRAQIDQLLSFCELHSGDDLPIDESDIGRVIEENWDLFHQGSRQDCTVFVKGILSSIMLGAKQKEVHELDAEMSDEIICLAALLRVIGSSILHILHHFRQMSSATDQEHRSCVTLCKEYNVYGIIIYFLGQHETNELDRYDLQAIIGKPVDSGCASMLMLAHFASLFTFCLRRRLGFLWKGCIIMMMIATNLIAEEQNLGTFQFLIGVSKELAVPCNTKEVILQPSARSKEIVSRYKRSLRKVHNKGSHCCDDGSRVRKGKADGKSFLECLPEYNRRPESWADIVDYIECEEEEDYSDFLKRRQKFTKFKNDKWFNKREQFRQQYYAIKGPKSRRKFGKSRMRLV